MGRYALLPGRGEGVGMWRGQRQLETPHPMAFRTYGLGQLIWGKSKKSLVERVSPLGDYTRFTRSPDPGNCLQGHGVWARKVRENEVSVIFQKNDKKRANEGTLK